MFTMEEIQTILAKNLKKLREDRHWSQDRLAEIAGLDKQAVQLAETGKRWPRLDTVMALARALECSQAELFASQLPDRMGVEEAWKVISDELRRAGLLRREIIPKEISRPLILE